MTEAEAMSPTSARVVAALKPLTPFAEAIVKRQVERAGLSLASFGEHDLPRIVPMIVVAAKMFLDPGQLEQLKRALE